LGLCTAVGSETNAPAIKDGTVVLTAGPLGAGRTLSAAFEVTEDLALDPVVTLAGAAASVTLARTVAVGRKYTFSVDVDRALGDGAATVSARLVDLAGNVNADAALGTLTIDLVDPAAAVALVSPASGVASASTAVRLDLIATEP